MGFPIPEVATQEDLEILEALIKKHEADRCIFAGDLIHSKEGLSQFIIDLFSNWLKKTRCAFYLIFGNHDRPLVKRLPSEWNLQVFHAPWNDSPFSFCHEPEEKTEFFSFSGHLHPLASLKSSVDEVRLPCFILKKRGMVLPAFSSLAPGKTYVKQPEDQIFITTGKRILRLD